MAPSTTTQPPSPTTTCSSPLLTPPSRRQSPPSALRRSASSPSSHARCSACRPPPLFKPTAAWLTPRSRRPTDRPACSTTPTSTPPPRPRPSCAPSTASRASRPPTRSSPQAVAATRRPLTATEATAAVPTASKDGPAGAARDARACEGLGARVLRRPCAVPWSRGRRGAMCRAVGGLCCCPSGLRARETRAASSERVAGEMQLASPELVPRRCDTGDMREAAVRRCALGGLLLARSFGRCARAPSPRGPRSVAVRRSGRGPQRTRADPVR
mmetsp:Transcript_28881/g.76508  ORF Transcript_28881/g.76508 Transcript_28881/m.76508 type:complete len:271 (+) Transcript_28881:159-971(+)